MHKKLVRYYKRNILCNSIVNFLSNYVVHMVCVMAKVIT